MYAFVRNASCGQTLERWLAGNGGARLPHGLEDFAG